MIAALNISNSEIDNPYRKNYDRDSDFMTVKTKKDYETIS